MINKQPTITNVYKLPDEIVDLVKNDTYEYTPHRYSATEILNSTKEIILRRRFRHLLTEDVSDYINMLFGTAFHSLFETDDVGSEMRVEHPVGNAVLSGRLDEYKDYTVTDYKTATVWKIKNGDFADWETQVLVYAWLLSKNGHLVTKGRVVAFLKDFSKGRKQYDSQYPEAQIYVHEFDVTTGKLESIGKFINNKITEINNYINKPSSELPDPLDSEVWRTPDKFAVMRNNNMRAMRILDTKYEATNYMLKNNGDYIEVRPGVARKLEYDEGLARLFNLADDIDHDVDYLASQDVENWVEYNEKV